MAAAAPAGAPDDLTQQRGPARVGGDGSHHDAVTIRRRFCDDIGADPAHPTICGRCASNLDGAGETRTVA